MIKNLRYAIAAIAMMTCGATYAQDATEPEKPTCTTIEFVNVYGGFEAENDEKTAVYLAKHQLVNDAATITFAKGGAATDPNYNIKNKYICLFGGSLEDETKTEGNTMTYNSDKYITQINLVATKANPWGMLKVNCGTLVQNNGSSKRNVVWTNKDADGNYIDTKEVVFTVCSSNGTSPDGVEQTPSAKDQVRYVRTLVYTTATATGITSVAANTAKSGVRYNIAGQRVGNDFKGLVIENGQKKIVK